MTNIIMLAILLFLSFYVPIDSLFFQRQFLNIIKPRKNVAFLQNLEATCTLDCGDLTKSCLEYRCKCPLDRSGQCNLDGCMTTECYVYCECHGGGPVPPPPPPPPPTLPPVQGIDMSSVVNVEDVKCMVKANRTFVIFRVWRNNSRFDPQSLESIRNAWAGGMKSVDGYIFPNFLKDPKNQIDTLIDRLDKPGIKYGRLWVDVELGSNWSRNTTANVEFIKTIVQRLQHYNKSIGIYTSSVYWREFTGDSQEFSNYPLWYAKYANSVSNFSDFTSFGGWTAPVKKQYNQNKELCGLNTDPDWMPN